MNLENINKTILIFGPISEEGIKQLKNKEQLVIIPEGRPYLTGIKQTIPLLKAENIPFVYCTDNMLGVLFYKNKIAQTILFFKECKEEGLLAISGSLYVVLLSHLHKVPIATIPQGKFIVDNLDLNAITIQGQAMILAKDLNPLTIPPKDELISWDFLKVN